MKIGKYCLDKNKTTANVFNGLSIVRNRLIDYIENVDFTKFSASYDNLASLEFGKCVFNSEYAKDNDINGCVFGYTKPNLTRIDTGIIGYKDDKFGLLEGPTDGVIFNFFLKDTENFIEFIKTIKGYYRDSLNKNTKKDKSVLEDTLKNNLDERIIAKHSLKEMCIYPIGDISQKADKIRESLKIHQESSSHVDDVEHKKLELITRIYSCPELNLDTRNLLRDILEYIDIHGK